MSEHITWTTCPLCGEAAAIGWLMKKPIEFDCKTGCILPDLQLLKRRTTPDFVSSMSTTGTPDEVAHPGVAVQCAD